MRKINKEDLNGILENAYRKLGNENWYAFGIGQIRDSGRLYWYELASEHEIESRIANGIADEVWTVYPVELMDIDKEAREYLFDENTNMNENLLENKEILKKVYDVCYKDDWRYANFEEFCENSYFFYEDLEEACPEEFNREMEEMKKELREEVEQNNNFFNATIEEKAECILNKIKKEEEMSKYGKLDI